MMDERDGEFGEAIMGQGGWVWAEETAGETVAISAIGEGPREGELDGDGAGAGWAQIPSLSGSDSCEEGSSREASGLTEGASSDGVCAGIVCGEDDDEDDDEDEEELRNCLCVVCDSSSGSEEEAYRSGNTGDRLGTMLGGEGGGKLALSKGALRPERASGETGRS
jgi:hypothetical protein